MAAGSDRAGFSVAAPPRVLICQFELPVPLNYFLAAHVAAAEVIVLDPLYLTHDQDENDTRCMAALCQSVLRLHDASKAALIVVHHVGKSITRYEIGSAFRGYSAPDAVGDSFMLLTWPSPNSPPSSCASSFASAVARRGFLME